MPTIMEKTKPSNADKFATFFDRDWVKTKSTIRSRLDHSRTYDPTYSWEARSDNPTSFSRLQATDMPVQQSYPITMSGPSVIPLDKSTGLDVLNIYQSSSAKAIVPLTKEQQDLGMNPDYSGKIPICESANKEGKVVVLQEQAAFRNMHVQAPVFQAMETPAVLVAAGSQCDKILLTPAQRREILDFEKRKAVADEYIRTTTAARGKLRDQLTGTRFHRGVVGVDSIDNVESELYGQRAKRNKEENDYKAHIELERRSQLARNSSSMLTNGNILVPESIAPRVKTEKFYQSKAGEAHNFSFQETYNRIFCRVDAKADVDRQVRLREKDLNGKQYNLVTHTAIEHWPVRHSSQSYRPEYKTMAHASQAALEEPRNLQGSLRPV